MTATLRTVRPDIRPDGTQYAKTGELGKNGFMVIGYSHHEVRYYQGRKYEISHSHDRYVHHLDDRDRDFTATTIMVFISKIFRPVRYRSVTFPGRNHFAAVPF